MQSEISSITKHKKLQERIAQLTYPIARGCHLIQTLVSGLFRWQGIKYGVNRAIMRSKIGTLGKYSDISRDAIIKHPKQRHIGVRTSIGERCVLDAGGGIEIGSNVMISHLVSINSMSHETTPPYHRATMAATKIEDDAWIGAGAIILDGITIQKGAIVAAGSVVTKNVDAFTLVAGIPARKIRTVTNPRYEP